ncbi:MAG: penicillin-binding protein [Nitrospira sp.]|nr:penicillin-binding protein [Nitrospira sp.]
MVFEHRRLAERAKLQHVKVEEVQVRRGAIFDRCGRELALNIELESLYCDPENLGPDHENLKRLASTISREPHAVLARITTGGRFAWIERKLEPSIAEKVRALNIKGLGFIKEAKRFYPKGELAAHIVGFVGIDNQPLEGIELRYDKYLTAIGGKVSLGRDANGKTLSGGVNKEAKGNNLVLTLDEGLQYIVEKEIEKAVVKWRAKAATAIMMNPYTGEILALANSPAYDLNSPGKASGFERRNRAVTDCYEPGSTFKMIVGTAALEEKIVRPDTLFDVSRGGIDVGRKTIRDAHRRGVLTFREVIEKSSNVGSVMTGIRLGKERIYKYAKLFGIGEKTGIDLPGEVSGWIRPPEKWSGTSLGAIPIGQEVAVTPLQMVRAYAAIANGGFLVKPHVVSEIISPEGQVLVSFKDKEKKRILSQSTADTFREILKGVVAEGGTGEKASLHDFDVAGKTGTAQIIDPQTKRYSKEKYVSSFVGFVPADEPKIALIVVVYEPRGQIYGGEVAAPVFKEIVDKSLTYLTSPREDNHYKNLLLVSR